MLLCVLSLRTLKQTGPKRMESPFLFTFQKEVIDRFILFRVKQLLSFMKININPVAKVK